MREGVRRCLSVLMVVAVVGAGTVAFVNLDQGPEPIDQYGPVQEADALGVTTTLAITLVAAQATRMACSEEFVICQGDTKAINKTEVRETKVELSNRASTAAQQTEVFLDSMNNTLEGGKMVARSEGERAYYNAIQNGSSLAVARNKAIQAVKDFYHVKYQQVAKSWNIMAVSWGQYDQIESDSNLPSNYVEASRGGSDFRSYPSANVGTAGNTTIKAPNGENVEVVKLSAGSNTWYPNKTTDNPPPPNYKWFVGAINSSLPTATSPAFMEFNNVVNKIDSDSAEVTQGISTFANQTYDKAISGELNTSEYLSANTLAREFSQEGNDQAWAAIRLSQIEDVGLPEDMKNIGTVTVTSDGTTTEGVFLSKSNPESGSFSVGETYNATALPGEQMVVQQDGSYATLSGKFTIENVSTPDGGTKDSFSISNPDYQTTNMTEWKNQVEWLAEQRAEINARQERLLNDSSGPDWPNPFGGLSDTQKLLAIVAVAGAGLLILRN